MVNHVNDGGAIDFKLNIEIAIPYAYILEEMNCNGFHFRLDLELLISYVNRAEQNYRF